MGRRLPAYPLYLGMSAVQMLLFTMLGTVSGIYTVTDVGLDPLQLVLVGTTLEAAAFLFEVPTGVVADAYSRRLSVIIGMFLSGAGFLLYAVPSFGIILLAQVVWGIGFTFLSGATEAWVADEVGEHRSADAFLRGTQAGQAGAVCGILLGVSLGAIALWLPMAVAGAGFLLLGIALALVMPEHGFIPAPRGQRSSWAHMGLTFRSGVRAVRNRPVLLTILAIAVFAGAASEAFDRLDTIHFIDDTGLPARGDLPPVVWFGMISMCTMLLSIGAVEVVRRRVAIHTPRGAALVLMAFTGVLLVSVLGFALATSFELAVSAYLLARVIRRCTVPITTTWLNQGLDSSIRATVLSMRSQADALGQIGGGPVLGLVARLQSVPVALTGVAVLLVPTLPLYLRALRGIDGSRSDAPAASLSSGRMSSNS